MCFSALFLMIEVLYRYYSLHSFVTGVVTVTRSPQSATFSAGFMKSGPWKLWQSRNMLRFMVHPWHASWRKNPFKQQTDRANPERNCLAATQFSEGWQRKL
jgi:hypothetical protein